MEDRDSLQIRHPLSMSQDRLLPLMVTMLIVLALLFFIAGFVQFYYLNQMIEKGPKLEASALVDDHFKLLDSTTPEQQLDFIRWKTLSLLEGHAVQQRYHQAKIFLMSRIWTRYLGFITGMTLALVGASFILGKLREPESRLGMDQSFFKISIITASPGLILTILGTSLMIMAMMSRSDIYVKDLNLYTKSWFKTTSHKRKNKLVVGTPEPFNKAKKIKDKDKEKIISKLRNKLVEQKDKK
ncbi:MAG: hypothetical protein V3U87_06705 [Methylococcaceae bacterium]